MTRTLASFKIPGLLAAAALALTGVSACTSTSNEVAPSAEAAAPFSGLESPQVLAASTNGKLLYVAQNDGTVAMFELPSSQPAGSWNSGVTNPLGIALSPDNATAYLANRSAGTVVLKNAQTGSAVGSWSTGSGTNPTGIGLSPDGATIYVPQNASAGTGADKLTVRVAQSGALKQTWEFKKGSRPRAAVISPDGTRAYVSMEGGNRIAVLDTSDGSELSSWDLAALSLSNPGYLALSPNGDKLYVNLVNPAGPIAFDTSSGKVIEKWGDAGKSPFGVALASCGQTLFVSDWTNPGSVQTFDQPNQCEPIRVPSAPQQVRAVFNNKTDVITVTWQAPKDSGGSPITGYTATAVDSNKKTPDVSCQTKDGSTLTCGIKVGNPGPRYDVTVTASNAAGTGPASAPVDVKTK